MYFFKYPKSIITQFKEKTEIAKKWIAMNAEERKKEKTFNFFNFQLIISEFSNKNVYFHRILFAGSVLFLQRPCARPFYS